MDEMIFVCLFMGTHIFAVNSDNHLKTQVKYYNYLSQIITA